MDRGVLYIAFGNESVEEALHSARSVRRHSPGLGSALFADADRRPADKRLSTGRAPALLAPRILHRHGLHRSPRWWSRLSPKYRPYQY